MERYDEHEFRARIDAALARIRTVLEVTRNPQHPADVAHGYDDKYALAEFLARVAIASQVQCLEALGLTPTGLETLRGWAKSRSVTLRFVAKEECTFLRSDPRIVESSAYVSEVRGTAGASTRTDKVVTTIVEHFWRFSFEYGLFAFQGNSPDKGLELFSRKGGFEIKTGAKVSPRLEVHSPKPVDVNVTWLLGRLDAESRASFTVDRTASSCHTPRRNVEVDAAIAAMAELHLFCEHVVVYFLQGLFPAQPEHKRDLSALTSQEIFVPVVPLFEEGKSDDAGLLLASDAHAFLDEERRTHGEKCRALAATFPSDGSAITAFEAGLVVTMLHLRDVCQAFSDGVDHIENMLRTQLIAAIGKEVTPAAFDAYMQFHHRKLVKPAYWPKPFSYAVRRPDHAPEGVVGIEANRGGTIDPITTTVASSEAQRPMFLALDASTRVSFLGERHLHAWIGHQFSQTSSLSLRLVARARQFSSFILAVGRIASATEFQPRAAIILTNKDALRIPLFLEQIPTPKEFRDAIESLSPEQQRFAKAFRGMQLESSLFGVVVIQIKPQLEKVLKLPPDALTKEIRLTQDLMSLFVEYQIPSDLLSYDGPEDASQEQKLARVTEHVGKMLEMIDLSKKREIEEEQQREALRLAAMNRSVTPAYGPPGAAPLPPPAFMPPPAPAARARSMTPSPAMIMPSPAAGPVPMSPSAAPPPPQAAPPPPQAAPVAAASAMPQMQAATDAASTQARSRSTEAMPASSTGEAGDVVDYTRIPGELDEKFARFDDDGALRATIINPDEVWTVSTQKGLLSTPIETSLFPRDQKVEKNRAFDLLDALSKSGALPIEEASLHVVLAATHGFDRTLLETVIRDNVNPIEKVERSLLIVGTTIHKQPASELLADDRREAFIAAWPKLGA